MPGKNKGSYRMKTTGISFQSILKNLDTAKTMTFAFVTKQLGDRRIMITMLTGERDLLGKSIQSRVKRTLKRNKMFVNVGDVVVVEYGEVMFRCDKSQIRQLQKKKIIPKNYDNFDPNSSETINESAFVFYSDDDNDDDLESDSSDEDDDNGNEKNKNYLKRIKDKDNYLDMKSKRSKKININTI